MFRAYFDDSGTHIGGGAGPAPVVVVGGVVAEDEQLDRFNDTWMGILGKNNLPYFHTTKFKVAKDPPYSKMSEGEKDVLLYQLLLNIAISAEIIVNTAVRVADYDVVLTQDEKARYGKPYVLAAQLCWLRLRLWAERYQYDDPIPFVVESGTEDGEQLSVVFNKMMADPKMRDLYHLHSLTCGAKVEFPALQAADIVANSTYELAGHYEAGGRIPSKWVGLVSRHLGRFPNHQVTANEKVLRAMMDDLNEHYNG